MKEAKRLAFNSWDHQSVSTTATQGSTKRTTGAAIGGFLRSGTAHAKRSSSDLTAAGGPIERVKGRAATCWGEAIVPGCMNSKSGQVKRTAESLTVGVVSHGFHVLTGGGFEGVC